MGGNPFSAQPQSADKSPIKTGWITAALDCGSVAKIAADLGTVFLQLFPFYGFDLHVSLTVDKLVQE